MFIPPDQEAAFRALLHAPGLPEPLLASWRERIDRWSRGAPLDDASALNHGEVFRVGDGAEAVVFKRSWQTGWKAVAQQLGARQSPLERAYRLGLEARDAGLSTPAPLAYFQRALAHGYEEVLVTRFVHGAPPWLYLREHPAAKPRLFALLGREIASWHARGFRHRDLKGPNLLYSESEDRLHLLDLDGAHRVWPLPSTAVRSQDLGRLKASALSGGVDVDEWEDLFGHYLEACHELGIPVRRTRAFHAAIERRALRKLRRNQRRRRPLA